MLVIYDLWSARKLHRSTLWAGGFLVFVSQVRLPIGKTAAWHAFTSWVQEMAPLGSAPAMVMGTINAGSKYPSTMRDHCRDFV